MTDIMETETDNKLKLQAACEVLNRAGYGVTKRVDIQSVNTQVTSDQIAALKEKVSGLVDVTPAKQVTAG